MSKQMLKLCPVFLLLIINISCRSRYIIRPVINFENELLPSKSDGSTYTKEQVQEVILEACQKRGWAAQVEGDGVIDASIFSRNIKAEVEIQYNERTISITYKDSENLDYLDGNIHRTYNSWVTNLHKTIFKYLTAKESPEPTGQAVLNFENENLPSKLDGTTYSMEQVRKAILEACRQHDWIAQLKDDGVIDAALNVRSSMAKVEIQYTEKKISIIYKDSRNLNYVDGTIHRNYNSWVSRLYSSILKDLPAQK